MLYKETHPDFDNGNTFEYALGVLEGHRFSDQSYKNDTCPCLIHYIDQDNEEYIGFGLTTKTQRNANTQRGKNLAFNICPKGLSLSLGILTR